MAIVTAIAWLMGYLWRFLKRPVSTKLPVFMLSIIAQYAESNLSKIGIAPSPEYVDGLFIDLENRLEEWRVQGKSENAIKRRVVLWLFSFCVGIARRMLDKAVSQSRFLCFTRKVLYYVKARSGFLSKRDHPRES